MVRFGTRALTRLEVWQIRRFGRSLLSLSFRTPVLVLHTVGRRSGREHRTPLAHRRRGGDLLVVGGAAGQRATPDWVANLRAERRAEITIDRRRVPIVSEELVGDERGEHWAMLRVEWPRIERYERRSGRRVPVFRLREIRG